MRILVVNKFWYRRGGLESVMFDEISWLEAAGHEVAHFSTAHPENEESTWSGYFAPYRELGAGTTLRAGQKIRAALNMFWNREAAQRFDSLLRDCRPDLVHIHGIHRQLSPSILGVSARNGVPVVQTIHDYHHLCPADVLLYPDGTPCDPRRCGVFWYGPCVAGRCVRGDLAASILSAAETSWQRVWRSYERGVARFVTPSRFSAELMRRGGWTVPCDVVPNAVPNQERADVLGSGFCVVGRLSREKGVDIALAAARRAQVRMTVAGEGPLGSALEAAYPEVDFVGRLDAAAVAGLIARSRAVVVPSVCFETSSMSSLEAMAAGKPVIASAIGAIPELVTSEVDGLLVRPGDFEDLTAAMRRISQDDALCACLSKAARETVATRFSPERHMEGLLAVYRAACESQ